MRELNNGDVLQISGAGVTVGGSIVGCNGGGAMSGVGIGNGAHVVVSGKPIEAASGSIDGVNIGMSVGGLHLDAAWQSALSANLASFLASLNRGLGGFFR
ncbi:hypothetical protein [Burkholderia metallica]|uniref:hypothetical protein n=1 Tax=Burkholderia metallica TaxID=488729 RepID=UPI00157659DA|nr:hypothetical protein [Burkholderia metallica]NTZ09181.1 hypothetical protein [Burkholderia metallica]